MSLACTWKIADPRVRITVGMSAPIHIRCDGSRLAPTTSPPTASMRRNIVDTLYTSWLPHASIARRTPLSGADAVVVTTEAGAVVERKVALPLRWIKGLGEVGAAQAAMAPGFELPGLAAMRLLRSLPRAGRFFAAPAGASAEARPGSVWVDGAERLRLLKPLLRRATQ